MITFSVRIAIASGCIVSEFSILFEPQLLGQMLFSKDNVSLVTFHKCFDSRDWKFSKRRMRIITRYSFHICRGEIIPCGARLGVPGAMVHSIMPQKGGG